MKKTRLISLVLLCLLSLSSGAQYFNSSDYVLHRLYENSRRLKGASVNTSSGQGSFPDSALILKWMQEPGTGEPQTAWLTYHITRSVAESAEGDYKNALENAVIAQRLAQKENETHLAELTVLLQAKIFYDMGSFKNVTALAPAKITFNVTEFQLSYLILSACLQMSEYDKTIALSSKIISNIKISSFDELQVLKIQALAFEKQKNYPRAIQVTQSADSLISKMLTMSYPESVSGYMFYNGLTAGNYQEKLNTDLLVVRNNLGFLWLKNNEPQKAVDLLTETRDLARNNKQTQLEQQVEKNLGLTYTILKQYDKAEQHYQNAEVLSDKAGLTAKKAEVLCLRAKNQYLNGNLAKARELGEQSVEITEANKDYIQLSQSYAVLAEINAYVGDIQKATFYSKLSEDNANRARQLFVSREAAELKANSIKEEVAYDLFAREKAELEMIQLKLEATRRAQELEIIKQENQIKESVLTAQKLESEKAQQALLIVKRELDAVKHLREIEEMRRDRSINILENKNSQTKIRLLNKQRKLDEQIKAQKEKDVKRARIRENNLRIILIISLVILVLIGFLLYRNNKNARIIKNTNNKLEELTLSLQNTNQSLESTLLEVNHKNEVIESKNHLIMESINYASRIQRASLPKPDEIERLSREAFVLFKPKDVISGDFYIVADLKPAKTGELCLYVVADCTGHGVPGAMLALLCSSLVRQTINQPEVNTPATVLNEVNKKLFNFFRNKENDSFKDGMDIACCVVDKAKKKLYFSGAGRPLLYINEGQIIELKGDKHHIGFSTNLFNFTLQEIDIEMGACVYLFTDGYTDQFNGLDRKRFMSKNLKNLLLQLSNKPMQKQVEALDEEFEKWRGDYVQMDDVCVLGIRI